MRLKANRTLHVSGVGSFVDDQEFEVGDALGKEMIEKGLAVPVGKPAAPKAEPAPPKAEPATLNKMDAPPLNKAVKGKPVADTPEQA